MSRRSSSQGLSPLAELRAGLFGGVAGGALHRRRGGGVLAVEVGPDDAGDLAEPGDAEQLLGLGRGGHAAHPSGSPPLVGVDADPGGRGQQGDLGEGEAGPHQAAAGQAVGGRAGQAGVGVAGEDTGQAGPERGPDRGGERAGVRRSAGQVQPAPASRLATDRPSWIPMTITNRVARITATGISQVHG